MNLKERIKRTLALLVVAFIFIGSLPLSVFADIVPIKQAAVDIDRFMTKRINSEEGFIETDENGYIVLTPNGKNPSILISSFRLEQNVKTNSIRFVIKNSTSCKEFEINYTYTNEENLRESANEKVQLIESKNPIEYIVPLEGTDALSSLKITFPCDGEGNLTILSISNVSYYFDEREYFGTLTENKYDRESGKAHLGGNVSYDINVKYPDAKVVLYRLDQDKTIEDLKNTQSYIASCDMTLNYGFTFYIEKTSDLCSRYFVAVLTPDDKVFPVTTETYIKETYTSSESLLNGKEPGFKGIESNLNAGAGEMCTSVAYIDVYLDKMASESKNGYQYTLDDGKEYYFDREYISQLDGKIRSFAVSGTSIYLRFLLSPHRESLKYADISNIPNDVKYVSINPHDDKSVRNLYASTDFLFRRYVQNDDITLRGVVIGRSLDKVSTYNYCTPESMNDYVDMLARTCSIVRRVLDAMGSELEIVLPISDEPIGVERIITKENKTKSYPTDLFTSCVIKALNHYGTDTSSIYFMIESSHTPVIFDNSKDHYLLADNCKQYIDLLKDRSKTYADTNSKIMFCWLPSKDLLGENLKIAYIYSYNHLACTDGIRTFVLSLFENTEEIEFEGTKTSLEHAQLKHLRGTFKYADTCMNKEMGKGVLDYFKVDSWSDIIKGYDFNRIERKEYYNKNLEYILPNDIVGNYRMFDFGEANGTKGWGTFDGCKSLLVYTEPFYSIHSLVACMSGTESSMSGGEYGSIIHRFNEPVSTRDVSYISFDLFITLAEIDDDTTENYEIVLSAGNDKSISETVGTIQSGIRTTIIADITELDSVDYIKVSIKNLDKQKVNDEYNLCIEKIDFHSTSLNDRELYDKMSEGFENEAEIPSIFKDNTELTVVCLVVGISIVLLCIVWIINSKRKNAKQQ